jgi:hypothetical protein
VTTYGHTTTPSSQPGIRQQEDAPKVDPAERYIPLLLKVFGLVVLGALLYDAADYASTYPPHSDSFFFLQVYTWIILPMHEGGHFISRGFGHTFYILGGSFWQVMFPFLLVVLASIRKSFSASLYLIFTGVCLIAVAPYIYDAPYRSLPLLGGNHVEHDWWSLLSHWHMLSDAESIADNVYGTGVAFGGIGLVAGVVIAVYQYILSGRPKLPPPLPLSYGEESHLETRLRNEIAKEGWSAPPEIENPFGNNDFPGPPDKEH